METIPRSHTRRIAAIREQVVRCVLHADRNDYEAVEVDPAYAWADLERQRDARLTTWRDGWRIHLAGTDWYDLHAAGEKTEG